MDLFGKKKRQQMPSATVNPFPAPLLEDEPVEDEDDETELELERLKAELKKLEDEKAELIQKQQTKEEPAEKDDDELTEERLRLILQNFNARLIDLESRTQNTESFLFRHRSI